MRDRIRRACFDAVPAENAARIIYVVHLGVPLASRNPVRIRVFRSFDINAIRGTSCGAQKATYTLLQPDLVAVKHINHAIPGLKMHGLIEAVFRHRLPEYVSV